MNVFVLVVFVALPAAVAGFKAKEGEEPLRWAAGTILAAFLLAVFANAMSASTVNEALAGCSKAHGPADHVVVECAVENIQLRFGIVPVLVWAGIGLLAGSWLCARKQEKEARSRAPYPPPLSNPVLPSESSSANTVRKPVFPASDPLAPKPTAYLRNSWSDATTDLDLSDMPKHRFQPLGDPRPSVDDEVLKALDTACQRSTTGATKDPTLALLFARRGASSREVADVLAEGRREKQPSKGDVARVAAALSRLSGQGQVERLAVPGGSLRWRRLR
jgi:hypothetical protein